MAPHFMIKGGLLWLHQVIPPGSTCSTATLQTLDPSTCGLLQLQSALSWEPSVVLTHLVPDPDCDGYRLGFRELKSILAGSAVGSGGTR